MMNDDKLEQTTTEEDLVITKGNFEAVRHYITENVLRAESKAVLMEVLQKLYGIGMNDTRYRNKLKNKIQEIFQDHLLFLTVKSNTAEFVTGAKYAGYNTLPNNKASIISVSQSLREDIMNYSKELPKLPWPPSLDQLDLPERGIPESVITFYTELLKSERHTVSRSSNISRLVESYSSDLVFDVSRGGVLTKKLFLLALGMHNITGMFQLLLLVLANEKY